MEVTPQDAQFVRDLVFRQAAIRLDSEKDYFIEMRLAQLAGTCGAATIAELVESARRGVTGADVRIVEALATHETYFFRDVHPFEALKKELIPRLMAARQSSRQLTIWCAACSSGQEPYSLALLIREHFAELAQWKVRIIATDMSEQILAKARGGSFTQMEVNRGLPAMYLPRYFERNGLNWQVKATRARPDRFSPPESHRELEHESATRRGDDAQRPHLFRPADEASHPRPGTSADRT